MYIIQDRFQCKPGKSTQVAEIFKGTLPMMKALRGFKNGRVMVDFVASYWTVVFETEVEDLGEYEAGLKEFRSKPDNMKAMAGYMDLIEGGRREIFRIV